MSSLACCTIAVLPTIPCLLTCWEIPAPFFQGIIPCRNNDICCGLMCDYWLAKCIGSRTCWGKCENLYPKGQWAYLPKVPISNPYVRDLWPIRSWYFTWTPPWINGWKGATHLNPERMSPVSALNTVCLYVCISQNNIRVVKSCPPYLFDLYFQFIRLVPRHINTSCIEGMSFSHTSKYDKERQMS